MKATNTLLLSLIAIFVIAAISTGGYIWYSGRYLRHEETRQVSVNRTNSTEDDTIYESFT